MATRGNWLSWMASFLRLLDPSKRIMRPSEALQGLIAPIHKVMASSAWLAKIYLLLWSNLLRRLPGSRVKNRLVHSLEMISWPAIAFKPIAVVVGKDTQLYITPHHGEFDFAALFHRRLLYEKEVFYVLEKYVPYIDGIIEIGANVGVYTTFFSKLFSKLGRLDGIFAFEPSSEAFSRLRGNLRANKAENVHTFQCAVGERHGFMPFYEPEGHLTNGSLRPDFASIFSPILQVKLALVLDGQDLAQLTAAYPKLLIKIDVEGSESAVLCSLRQLIETRTPTLVLEVLPDQAAHLNKLDFIHAHYMLFNITTHGLVRYEQFVATSFRDYLLLPTLKI